MEIHDLHTKINIVLDEEVRSYAAKGRSSGGLGSMNIGLQSEPNRGFTTERSISKLLFNESDPNIITSPNAIILLKLYSTLNNKSKVDFKNYLISHLKKDSLYTSIAYFIFFILYRTGDMIKALTSARENLAGDSVHGYSNLLGILSMIISREYLEIDKKTYNNIKSILESDTEHDFRLQEKINSALLKHLEQDLNDVNPEINTDRDKVLELWNDKFSSTEVPSLVCEIDDYFREGEFTKTKYATCIGRIRVLLVEVSKKIALGLAVNDPKDSISKSSDEHHVFDYLRSKKFISNNEWNILRSLYGMSSNEGSHAPVSKREYARLTKNMAYEIVLLFLSKYKL